MGIRNKTAFLFALRQIKEVTFDLMKFILTVSCPKPKLTLRLFLLSAIISRYNQVQLYFVEVNKYLTVSIPEEARCLHSHYDLLFESLTWTLPLSSLQLSSWVFDNHYCTKILLEFFFKSCLNLHHHHFYDAAIVLVQKQFTSQYHLHYQIDLKLV